MNSNLYNILFFLNFSVKYACAGNMEIVSVILMAQLFHGFMFVSHVEVLKKFAHLIERKE